MIGPGITAAGEIHSQQQLYSNQLVATIAGLLGEKFETTSKIGQPLILPSVSIEQSVVVNR